MRLGKLAIGLILATVLITTGCCGTKTCGRPATVASFPPPCNTCPNGQCNVPPPGAPAQTFYSAPPAATIPNGYAP